jgi:hypothetical protein
MYTLAGIELWSAVPETDEMATAPCRQGTGVKVMAPKLSIFAENLAVFVHKLLYSE